MSTQQESGCLLGVHDDKNLSKRRKFRILLFHILYATDAYEYEIPPKDIAVGLNTAYNAKIPMEGDLIEYAEQISTLQSKLDEQILPFLENWKIDRIGKCTLLTLRIATWEMLYTDTAHQIVINEAIELAKLFAEKDAYRFVNGILDKMSIALQEKNEDLASVAENEQPSSEDE